MDGERSRFLMRLRIVPLPSAALIALLAARLTVPVSGYWSLSVSLCPPLLSCCRKRRVQPVLVLVLG
ncbi:Alanine aminotransferase 2 [Dissostichus eleginoides]|uniref:Alanine aminotransferase 2 n=1 Tax=Dissostichus eleginoides TaxID=100907 RepID=A0AAD9B3U1_DISEL|nr:Alanine aminotransferase 2 [Dissostichus eleginoides]